MNSLKGSSGDDQDLVLRNSGANEPRVAGLDAFAVESESLTEPSFGESNIVEQEKCGTVNSKVLKGSKVYHGVGNYTDISLENVDFSEIEKNACLTADDSAGLCESATSGDSATIDTESADDYTESVQTNVCAISSGFVELSTLPKATVSVKVREVNDDQLSLQSFDSESSKATLSSDHSGRRPKYVPDSSEEEDLLSELESELESCVISTSNHEYRNHDVLTTSELASRKKRGQTKQEHTSQEFYEVQMEVLQQNIRSLHNDLSAQYALQAAREVEYNENLNRSKAEYVVKLDKLVKQCEMAKREKESMVVRYAQSEREVIILKKVKEDLEKKLHDILKDRESMQGKIRVLHADRVRACSSLDSKLAELAHTQRDMDKLREELNCREIKINWAENKLKAEADAHKETQSKLDQTTHRLHEMREESEQIRKDCQEMIRRYQEAEEIKSVSLDIQLKEKLSELEVQKQEKVDQEEVYGMLRQELDALKKRQRVSVEENNSLTVKIQTLERERLEYEQTLSKLKDSQNSLRQEVVDLNTRLSEMESLRQQMKREKERVLAAQKEAERVRFANLELQADMDACHSKEGELLEFTERLTAKSMQLQSEHSLLEVKAQSYEENNILLNRQVEEMDILCQRIQDELSNEKKMRLEETQILARKLAERTKTVENLNLKLEEAMNENRVMKRRHITSIKELSRELFHSKKRLDAYESPRTSSSAGAGPGDNTSLGSRTSSSGSLDTIAPPLQNVNGSSISVTSLAPQIKFSGQRHSIAVSPLTKLDSNQSVNLPHPPAQLPGINVTQANNNNVNTSSQPIEIDRQILIERIVRLQKQLPRKNEKIEFLEEHVSQLLAEIKKKSRIIQSYILREESGALVPSSMDQNKAELSRHKGIMSSMYKSQLTDNGLTLELSLEINQKLQAVLEDTLLKNITLKENINTLGEEIARISKEQRDLQISLQNNKNL